MSLPQSQHDVPFLKLLIPLILGIAAQYAYCILPNCQLLLCFTPILLALLIAANILARQWRFRWIFGLLLYATIFILGMLLPVQFGQSNCISPSHTSDVLVKIADTPQKRVKSYRVEAEVVGQFSAESFQVESERILLYFSIADTLVPTLGYADVLAVRIKPQAFEQPANPYQFNFAKYMQRRGIRYSSFIANGEWQKVDNRANVVIGLAKETRSKLLNLFAQSGLKTDELAVVSALTVGYKNLLDDELYKTYSAAGATHILAVSGLHVGIIYGMMVFLLSLIPRMNRHIKMFISIFFLWFFAFITGLSPSVLRAASMFSMVEVGRNFGFRANTYNTLAAVAFIMLVAEPNNLFGLGFQLSFLAVLSIVFFYPHISGLLYFKHKILSWIWDLVSVSIAAQIGTLPVVLLNFGQFSNYFLLTNMLAIPMATVILYLSVLLVAVSAIPVVSGIVAVVLNFSVSFLNSGLRWIENLPCSVSSGIYCSMAQLVILLVAIALLAVYLEQKRANALHAFLVCLCIFFAIQQKGSFGPNPDELVVFSLPRKSTLCLNCDGHTTFFSADSSVVDIPKDYSFYLSGYIENEADPNLSQSYNLARFKTAGYGTNNLYIKRKNGLAIIGVDSCLIAFPYNDSVRFISSELPLMVDLLMVNSFVDESIIDKIRPKMAVFDESVRAEQFPKLAELMLTHEAKVHDLHKQGAYRLTF